MIPQDFLQQLLDRTDIVAVIERYVPLKKAGANYQSRCPFHEEKSPSFTVSPSKQFYHCFGCGAHGTAIRFLMDHAGLPFVEAVKELAGRAGMQVPDDGSRRPPEEESRRATMFERMDAAATFYRKSLKSGAIAVDYLKNRGLTGETAARFGIGYAPEGWQSLREAMAAGFADYADPLLMEVGLVIHHEDKRYDRFRERVMFPIRNERGQVIAFGGRVLGKGEPKYLNSPETPLFHKGRELYGLHEHRRAIQGDNQVVVVEGYMDVVMLDQHGVQNAVATLGTAITSDQAARLLRLADDVVFAFDGDNAGRKAAWRALENSLPQAQDGKRLSFLFLPEGEDPDSYVRAQGADAFRALCEQAMPLSDFLFSELTAQTDLGSQEGQVRLAKLVEPHIDKLAQAPLLQRMLRQRLAGLTGLEAPRAARTSLRAAPTPNRPRGRAVVQPSAWQIALQAVLHDPMRARRMAELPESERPEAVALATVVALLREHPELNTRDLVEHFRDRPEQALFEHAAAGLLAWDEGYDVEADFQGALNNLSAQAGRAEARELTGRRPSELSPEEKTRLLAALQRRKPPEA
jgi:DNA primase